MEILKAESLPPAPVLESLHIPKKIEDTLVAYAAEKDSWEGLSIIVGKEAYRSQLIYALLAKFTETPIHIKTIDHEQAYALPEPPRLYEPIAQDVEVTLDDLLARQDESQVTQIQVADEGEYVDAIRASLRFDPDLLAIGDIPSKDVLDLAVSAASMGQRVLAKMPGVSVEHALESLRTMNPSVTETLRWILITNEHGCTYQEITPELRQKMQK